MSIERILVADDEILMRQFISDTLKRMGKEVFTAANGKEACFHLDRENIDLVISDVKMPILGGLEVLKKAKSLTFPPFVILMTAFGSIESAVEAMRLGAFHFLMKPFPPETLECLLEQCEAQSRLSKENRYLREDLLPHAPVKCPKLIAHSPAMQQILSNLEKVAKSHASLFITGESGTGKEVIAGAIHHLSNRSSSPFIKVNCAAIPETLIESEFFGHEKGAFTGAHTRKIGRFELADEGSLLLDEVTEIPLCLQPKLLRAIQEQEFERVGGIRSIRVNLRFLATSNRNMQQAIKDKVFREDLYYRLNVVPIHIPALRDRPEDIIPLAKHFLDRFCSENHKTLKQFSLNALCKLQKYPWPGNVRELANAIERTVVLDFGHIVESEHICLEAVHSHLDTPSLPIESSLEEVERRFILQTLESHHNHRAKTACALGISERTLRNKLIKYKRQKIII